MTAARLYKVGEEGYLTINTLLEVMKAKGYRAGVVTTSRIMRATPTATYLHICPRDGENNIAARLRPKGGGFKSKLSDGVDVIFGASRNRQFIELKVRVAILIRFTRPGRRRLYAGHKFSGVTASDYLCNKATRNSTEGCRSQTSSLPY